MAGFSLNFPQHLQNEYGIDKTCIGKKRWAHDKEKVEQQDLSVRAEKEKYVPVKLCIPCFLITGSEMKGVLQPFLKHRWPKFLFI